ncbi:MAG: hypothetical protein ACP5OG_00370 [Candidatus Nanoarchaeia archaeon]
MEKKVFEKKHTNIHQSKKHSRLIDFLIGFLGLPLLSALLSGIIMLLGIVLDSTGFLISTLAVFLYIIFAIFVIFLIIMFFARKRKWISLGILSWLALVVLGILFILKFGMP